LQFTMGELATAVELALPLPILLWNNRGYGEIKRYMEERSIPQIGVDIYTPDFLTIARGFGCRTERAEGLKQLRWLLEQSQQEAGPTLIEIDEEAALGW
jgi:acetolactate synthase I/II/III large subunit